MEWEMKTFQFMRNAASSRFFMVLLGSIMLVSFCAGLSFNAPARADEVVLKIQPPDNAPIIEITEAEVRAAPAITIETLDPWDNRKRTYTGCNLLEFLNKNGIDDFDLVEITAKNDFRAKITRKKLQQYKYLLTYAHGWPGLCGAWGRR